MKKYAILFLLSLMCAHANAGWAEGISAASKGYADSLRQEAAAEHQHKLDMKRMEREFELRAKEQERIRQQDAQRYAADQQTIKGKQDQRKPIERAQLELAMSQVEAAHPGWMETIKSPSFLKWRAVQPASLEALTSSDRSQDVILILDLYKRDQNPLSLKTVEAKASTLQMQAAPLTSAKEAAALDYSDWLKQQPEYIRALSKSPIPTDAIWLTHLYKRDQK